LLARFAGEETKGDSKSGDGDAASSTTATAFPVLRSLSLNSNLIGSFACVDAMRSLLAMTKLRLQQNPLEQKLPQNALRPLLIAMMPQLLAVNLSDVSVLSLTRVLIAVVLRRFARESDSMLSGSISSTTTICPARLL
jgi:hypothetical protein